MDFRAIYVLSKAVGTLMGEIAWSAYGPQDLHVPTVDTEEDCRKLDLLMDIMGTLTRMMDTQVSYVTTEGKVIREWIESILEICDRYQKELELIAELERKSGE